MQDHRRLWVWQKACELVVEIYRLTRLLPPDERFGLSSQMRRAAVSIPSNIAEGASLRTRKDFGRLLYVAAGSAAELETQLLLIRELGFVEGMAVLDAQQRVVEVRRMISGLLSRLGSRSDR